MLEKFEHLWRGAAQGQRLPPNVGLGLIVGMMGAVIGFIAITWLLWQIPWPAPLGEMGPHLRGWWAITLNGMNKHLAVNAAYSYKSYLATLPPNIPGWTLLWRFDFAAIMSILFGIGIGAAAGWPTSALAHVAGRQMYSGYIARKMLKKQADADCKTSGTGIKLHPSFDWNLSLDRESRHFLITGSIGGGKTQIILPMLKAAMERGDRLIIYDNKGDFTSLFPDVALLAPWDERTFVWDIAKDCSNTQDARELAARLIPPGEDPMWHSAARQIMAAVIMKLQHDLGKNWTWADLHEMSSARLNDIIPELQRYVPELRFILGEGPSKTKQSILIYLAASMDLIADLRAAWGDVSAGKSFSFAEWLMNENPEHKVIILQGSGRYTELTKAYIQSAIAIVTGRINSPEFSDSKTRRLWVILDEFPQLGELREFQPLLEVGRSKGVRVVLGLQDISQVKQTYGEHVASSWSSMVGTQIVVRVNPGDTANFISRELVGTRTVDRITVHQRKRLAPQREQAAVIEPADLITQLGVDKNGVRALILGYKDAFIQSFPFTTLPKMRESSKPARWLDTAKGAVTMRDPDPVPPPPRMAPPPQQQPLPPLTTRMAATPPPGMAPPQPRQEPAPPGGQGSGGQSGPPLIEQIIPVKRNV